MAFSLTWQEARDRLKKIRDEQLRSSEEVVCIWEDVLSSSSHKLANEEWVVYEQVCIAACDCGRIALAIECIGALSVQFPHSTRVQCLQGLVHEAHGSYDEAKQIYDDILEKDSNNSLVRKRKIAILKAKNCIPDAIKELNDYLQTFMSDSEAWMELSELYLQEMDYVKAAFCLEELILSNPYNHLVHQRYAEIRYTMGGTENIEIARKYFAQALKLKPMNLRALFGFFLSANHLAQKGKTKKENMDYAAHAWKLISQIYGEGVDKKLGSQVLALRSQFDSLQLS